MKEYSLKKNTGNINWRQQLIPGSRTALNIVSSELSRVDRKGKIRFPAEI